MMSKFDYGSFIGGYDTFAVSKEKFTKEQAIEIAKTELEYELKGNPYLWIGDGYVRHRAGVNEEHEPCVGWWLEYTEHKRSCPCWVFHTSYGPEGKYEFSKGYERIKVGGMMITIDTVHTLASLPASDLNFVSYLKRADEAQIWTALDIMKNREGKDKGRIAACERELRRRVKNENRSG